MRRKSMGRNARKVLAGVLVAVNIAGNLPVYASEQADLTQPELTEESIMEDESVLESEDSVKDEGVSADEDSVENETESSNTVPEEDQEDAPASEEEDSLEKEEPAEDLLDEAADSAEKKVFVEDGEPAEISEVSEDEKADEDVESELPLAEVDEDLSSLEVIYEEEYDAPEISASGDYTFDVTQYGANGSDKSSDSKAIQSVLDKAWNGEVPSGSRLVVKVPAGTYYLDAALGIYSNTSLELDENAIMVNDHLSESMLVNAHRNPSNPKELCDPGYAEHNCSHGGYTQGKDITISGGTWDGNVTDSSQMYASLISLRHTEGITIQNTSLKNGNGLHMLVLDGIKDANVDHVTFENCVYYTGKDTGYYGEVPVKDFGKYTELEKAELAQFKEAVHIDAMNKVGTEILPLDNTVCMNITVQNCTFKNVLAGVGAHHPNLPGGRTHNNIVIQNNVFTGLKGTAVCAMSMKDTVIRNNKANDVYIFANLCQTEASLSGNEVTNAHDVATYISDKSKAVLDDEKYEISLEFLREDEFAVDVLDSSVCTIKNSTVNNGGRGGIGARSGSTITVDNTDIKVTTRELKTIKSSPAGILIDRSTGTITGNRITGVQGKDYGILVQENTNQTVSIRDNEITHGYLGIGVLNSLGTIDLTKNTIIDMSSNGIWLNNSRALIDGNEISKSGVGKNLSAIQVGPDTPSGTMTIKNNKINGAYWGIYVTGEKGIRVEGNTVTKCKDVGVRITKSANIDVVNNAVTGTEKTGSNKAGWDITFWACTSGTCNGNTVTGNPKDNIQTDSTGVKIGTNYSSTPSGNWKKENGSWYLYDSQGKKLTKWQIVNGEWYYLDPSKSGKMHTGWLKDVGKWYYLNPDKGGKMSTNWQKIGGKWYYMNGSGVMQTGWKKISKKWYYMDGSGVMQTGWKKISKKWYYMDGSGVMQTGWKKISKEWYYMDGSGVMKTGWQKIGGKWYYMNGSGVMQTKWKKLGGKWYYFESSGAMVTGRKVIDGKTYSFSSDGVLK